MVLKKFENKHGKNQGYHLVVTPGEFKKRFSQEWGILPEENHPGLYKRHKVPKGYLIITHSIWAKYVMRAIYERIKTRI